MKIKLNQRTVWINYHHLYCFWRIAQRGSLKQASQELDIGTSALSIQLRQFEAQLGVTLFERRGRKLQATEHGQLMESYAHEIFRLGSEMVEALQDRPNLHTIHVHLGTVGSIPKHLIATLTETTTRQFECSITVGLAKSEDLIEGLLHHQIDIAIVNDLPRIKSEQIYAKQLGRFPLWIVGAPSMQSARRGFPHSLRGKAAILPTLESRVRREFDHYCKRESIEVDRLIEAQDVMVQKMLALKGLGFTVVPEFAVEEYLREKTLVRIGPLEGCFEEIHLIASKRKIDNPAASWIMKHFSV